MPITSVLTGTSLFGGSSGRTTSPTRRALLMRECGIDPMKLLLGTFTLDPGRPTDDPELTADDLHPTELATLSVTDRVELQQRANQAKANPSGLRPAPPPPPRKVGHHLDGTPMDLDAITIERPEPAPPVHRPVVCDDIASLRTVADCDVYVARAEQAAKVAQWSLDHLPAEAEGEPNDVTTRREKLTQQVRLLGEYLHALDERRSELFLANVEATAAKRQLAQDGGPRLTWPAAWHSGRMI